MSRFTSKVTVKLALIGKMVTLSNLPRISFDFGVIPNSYVSPGLGCDNVGSKVGRYSSSVK